MVQVSDELLKRMKKEFFLFDISKREFFVSHIKKSGDVYNPQYQFDDDAIIEMLKGDMSQILELFKDKYDRIKMGYVFKGDFVFVGSINKAKLASRINEIYSAGKLNVVVGVKELNDTLMALSDPQKANFGEEYTVAIDDKKLTIKTQELLNFIINDYKNYDFNKIKEINGNNKDEYCYCLKQFIIHSQLLTRYRFSSESYDFMEKIINERVANLTHFNSYEKIIDDNLYRTKLNDELIEFINKDMPQNYTPLQKSIYTYIKLCKVLTYDPEFYANNQSGMIAKEHRQIERLATITPNNSKIVCYEFTQIFAKFLYDLGINYIVDGGMDYGDSHANLSYRAGDFIVEADSVTSILGGDLFNAKVNNELVGLKCKNKYGETLAKFDQICRHVYEDIIEKEEIKNSDEALFDDFLDMLDSICEKEPVSFEQKMKIFTKQSQNIDLPELERITYLMRLSKAVFAEEAKANKFEVTILCKKVFEGYNIKSKPVLILSFNDKSFKDTPQESKYIMIDENGQLSNLYRETLINAFGYGVFKHITTGVENRHVIPGISEEEIENVK